MDFRDVAGHIEVYVGDIFLFSADNMCEARQIAKEEEENGWKD